MAWFGTPAAAEICRGRLERAARSRPGRSFFESPCTDWAADRRLDAGRGNLSDPFPSTHSGATRLARTSAPQAVRSWQASLPVRKSRVVRCVEFRAVYEREMSNGEARQIRARGLHDSAL